MKNANEKEVTQKAKTVKLKNGDTVKVTLDPNGEGWVIDRRQTGNKTGDVYDNGDEVTEEMAQ